MIPVLAGSRVPCIHESLEAIAMIVERNVFQAKYGRGDELVALMKEGRELVARMGARKQRVLTDLTGPFFTVVWESEYESMAEMEKGMAHMSDPEFGPWFERMVPLVDHGSRELFTIVD
jgi:hypothetical protein